MYLCWEENYLTLLFNIKNKMENSDFKTMTFFLNNLKVSPSISATREFIRNSKKIWITLWHLMYSNMHSYIRKSYVQQLFKNIFRTAVFTATLKKVLETSFLCTGICTVTLKKVPQTSLEFITLLLWFNDEKIESSNLSLMMWCCKLTLL